MSVVLKENEWAKYMVERHDLGKKPSETLARVARMYIDYGYSKTETRVLLDSFLQQCDPCASLIKWSDALDYAVQRAGKYKAVNIDYISITRPEMDVIQQLKGRQLQRLAFTLLCLAKYWNIILQSEDGWVNNKDNEIMSMSNINTSIKRQSLMFGVLRDLGLIQFSRQVDNTNVKVCFIQEGIEVLRVSDFRNLGYQFLKFQGEPFFECAHCGITTKIENPTGIGRPQKYCKNCAAEIKLKQSAESVARGRKVHK